MIDPPEWKSKQDVSDAIKRGLDGWDAKKGGAYWQPKPACAIVRDCAAANTYRAFAQIGKPSHIFRTWGWTFLQSGQLERVGSREDFDKLHVKLVAELRECWQCVAEKTLSFGAATKLLNLLILHACQCDDRLSNRGKLLTYSHVPLDEYVLRAIRNTIDENDPHLPLSLKASLMKKKQPSMGTITTYGEYLFIQEWIRNLTEESGAPSIILNYLTWELPHSNDA